MRIRQLGIRSNFDVADTLFLSVTSIYSVIAAKIIDKKEHINHDTGTYIYHYNCMCARSDIW